MAQDGSFSESHNFVYVQILVVRMAGGIQNLVALERAFVFNVLCLLFSDLIVFNYYFELMVFINYYCITVIR